MAKTKAKAKATPKTNPKPKALSKTLLIGELASTTGTTKKQAKEFLEALSTLVINQLNEGNPVVLPGLLKLTIKDKPATLAKPGINPFTGEKIIVKAKPASKAVKAVPLKVLKDNIS